MQIIDLQPFGQRYESSFACFDLLVMYQSETLIDHVQVHVLHLPMPVPPKGARRGMGYSPFSRAKRLRWLPRRGSNRRFVRPRMPPLRGPLWAKASGQLRFVFARIQIFLQSFALHHVQIRQIRDVRFASWYSHDRSAFRLMHHLRCPQSGAVAKICNPCPNKCT